MLAWFQFFCVQEYVFSYAHHFQLLHVVDVLVGVLFIF